MEIDFDPSKYGTHSSITVRSPVSLYHSISCLVYLLFFSHAYGFVIVEFLIDISVVISHTSTILLGTYYFL